AQSIRAGMAGQIEWDLDDAQHTGGGSGSLDLKQWGFWNIVGGTNGYEPAARDPRPWFYAWSLAAKYFPPGAQTLLTTYGRALDGLRAAAARVPNGERYDVSIAIVNDSDSDYTLGVVLPEALGPAVFAEYDYSRAASPGYPKDAELLPVPATTCE